MIKHLYIKNFVLIDELNLNFEDGFSAFIGETGAGKSIFIDAISLLRADRASVSFVAKGKDKAIVEGTFDLSNDKHALEVLAEAGFDVDDTTTFTREILSSGKTVARIDHRIVTLALMKNVLRDEIDIHGQRDNAYLLNTATHIGLLDAFLKQDELLNHVHYAYRTYKDLCDEKEKALQEHYNENDLEYLQYQISEIENAQLIEGEDEKLEEKEKQYRALKTSYEKINEIVSIYDDTISESFYELNKLTQSLTDFEAIENARNTINDAYYSVSDAIEEIRSSLDDLDLSEEEINAMEERLYLIQRMKRKYGPSIPMILEKKNEFEKQVSIISNRQKYLDDMDKKINQAFAQFKKYADQMSELRNKGAKDLDKAVAANLKDLKLPNARFFTKVTTCSANYDGIDRVEFMISMNQGQDLSPLSQTASGGELSRLMLGLKEVFSSLQGIQTVIFDEIDTGVSGPVAGDIGKKMEQISKKCQVFSVTHLAPVAAHAKNCYLVKKSDYDNATHTEVKHLNEEEIIEQLALISSGEITSNSIAAAKELYIRSHA